MNPPQRHRRSPASVALAGLLALAALTSCASLNFRRETETSGTFKASGTAFTFLSIDMPKSALKIAHENVSDANMANVQVQKVTVFPYLGPVDWILDIICIRYARISGTWGYTDE